MKHVPVLAKEIIEALSIKAGDVYLDGTLGGGSHAEALCKESGGTLTIVGLDVDSVALKASEEKLKGICKKSFFAKENFRNLDLVLSKFGIQKIDKALFDLGVSSYQIDESGRGFSFKRDEPLVMTLADGKTDGTTAYDVVNDWSEENLATIIYGFGEERYAKRIGKAICETRKIAPIKTTGELARVIERSVPALYRHGRIHPATRTFQAIRLAVNDELGALKEGMRKAFESLNGGGRLAIISFHSLEDREVKRQFREWKDSGKGNLITKRPIVPTEEEIRKNPRSRSAKLRIIEKI